MKNWLRPQQLVAKYWWLIRSSQDQANQLLALPLTQEKRDLVEAYVGLMDQPVGERIRRLKTYNLAKNRWFHSLVFYSLIVTGFGYSS